MKIETKLWYSVQNGGDGSAYPLLMESEAQCNLDQEYMDEGWGEPCCGCFIVESDGPVVIKTRVTTIEDQLVDLEENKQYATKGWLKGIEDHIAALTNLIKENQ